MTHTNKLTLAATALCLFALAACSNSTQETARNTSATTDDVKTTARAPDADAVRVNVSEIKLKAGGDGRAAVVLKIAEGFHVNANPASDKYLIATSVEARPVEGLKAGQAVYPAGVTKKFGFSEKPLSVYEGEVTITLPVAAESGTAKGKHTLPASVVVQPCNDTECFRRRVIEASIPVIIE